MSPTTEAAMSKAESASGSPNNAGVVFHSIMEMAWVRVRVTRSSPVRTTSAAAEQIAQKKAQRTKLISMLGHNLEGLCRMQAFNIPSPPPAK
mmetsp:Transcript_10430/g.21093  ORF Transcript_10430/g.21093 Transcript_10430/m.21093 type:complete len:92 (+) Transcript_10430:635-910(+)